MKARPPGRRPPQVRFLTGGSGYIDRIEFQEGEKSPFLLKWVESDGTRRRDRFRHESQAIAARKDMIARASSLPDGQEVHLFEEALAEHLKGEVNEQMRKWKEGAARNHLSGMFDGMPLHAIAASHKAELEKYLSAPHHGRGRNGFSRSHRRRLLGLFESVLESARGLDWIAPDLHGTVAPALPPQTKFAAARSRQVKTMPSLENLDAIKTAASAAGYMLVVVFLAIHAGLRIGEIVALEWRDIDLLNKLVNVHNTIGPQRRNTFEKPSRKSPKTRKSVRSVPIGEELLELLLQWRPAKWNPTDRVLFAPGTEYRSRASVSDDFKKVLVGAGIARWKKLASGRKKLFDAYGLHILRHACVAIWLWQKTPRIAISDIQKWIGHADQRTTLGIYAYIIRVRNEGRPTWPSDEAPEEGVASDGTRLTVVNGRLYRLDAGGFAPDRFVARSSARGGTVA